MTRWPSSRRFEAVACAGQGSSGCAAPPGAAVSRATLLQPAYDARQEKQWAGEPDDTDVRPVSLPRMRKAIAIP